MEFPVQYTCCPDLNLTEYHIRRMTQSFYSLGVFSAYLLIEKETVFRLGASRKEESLLKQILTNFSQLQTDTKPLAPEKIANWEEDGKKLQAVLIRFPHRELFIFGIVLQEAWEEHPRNRWLHLSESVLTYLSIGIPKRTKNLLSFRSFTEVFRKKVMESLTNHESGVLAHFYLQDLSPFFKPLGVVKSQEIIREVSATVKAAAKPGELLFQLNIRSFFLFCPGETMDHSNERLQIIYFPSKHLILDYKLKLFLVTHSIASAPNEFSDLFMENL